MSLTKKLLSGFGAMVALALVMSVGALLEMRDLNIDLDRAANITARKQYLAGVVNSAALSMTGFERGSVISTILGDKPAAEEYQSKFEAVSAALQEGLKGLHRIAESGETEALLQRIDRQSAAVREGHEEFRRGIANQQMDTALVVFSQKLQPQLEEIGRQSASLVQQQNHDLSAESAESASKSARGQWIAIFLTLLGGVVGCCVFYSVREASLSLKRLVARLAGNAEEVAGAASQVSSASHSLAAGASQQAASLQQTSASTEEIASITRRNADNALQVAGLMQISEQSAAEVHQTLDSMSEKMKEIDASSNKIARIIKVIDEIAFQTNILALNAAVEAARAGEAGLGFAVVADEVRNLAQRCAQAARDTASLIEESIETSRAGNVRLDRMAGAVKGMTEGSGRVKSLVDEVNLGSQEQTRGMDQIARAILQMQNVTQKNAAAAEESASAGAELDSHADALRQLVNEMGAMVGIRA
jgi:methyl-accepting chemotaxis protein/methyl-accepting chemotaxis protein-1 (serine sensor receptor)